MHPRLSGLHIQISWYHKVFDLSENILDLDNFKFSMAFVSICTPRAKNPKRSFRLGLFSDSLAIIQRCRRSSTQVSTQVIQPYFFLIIIVSLTSSIYKGEYIFRKSEKKKYIYIYIYSNTL